MVKNKKRTRVAKQPDEPAPECVVEGEGEDDDDGTDSGADKMRVEEQIVEFFMAHPIFYAKEHSDYKNREKKSRLLEQLAMEIGQGMTG